MKPLLGLLLLVAPLAALAQEGRNVSRVYAIRADLQDQLKRLELAAGSPAYSLTLRQQARFEAELVRRRLDEGDFQVGDRILLSVENEPALSDTFTVDPGNSIASGVIPAYIIDVNIIQVSEHEIITILILLDEFSVFDITIRWPGK